MGNTISLGSDDEMVLPFTSIIVLVSYFSVVPRLDYTWLELSRITFLFHFGRGTSWLG